MEHKKLYKTTSVGKIQVWWMETDEDKYRAHSGQLNGKIVTSTWTVALPKNIGKKNATTGDEQALSEVESTYSDKKKKGYVETIEDLTNGTFSRFQAMTAKDFKDDPRKRDVQEAFDANELVYSQPKYDGIRCVGSAAERLMSRWGTELVATPHVLEALQPIFETYPGIVIDGELYNHELRADFNSIVSLIRKEKPDPEDFVASEKVIKFYIYDCYIPTNKDSTFADRTKFLKKILVDFASPYFVIVPTNPVKSMAELTTLYEEYLEEEFEGQMIRLDGPYQSGRRSKFLIKRKEFLEEEFKVLDIVEGDGNRSGMAGRAICTLSDGRTFKTNIMGTREFLRELLATKERYIGGVATVKFGNYTPAGIPRFGRIKTFWPDGRDL